MRGAGLRDRASAVSAGSNNESPVQKNERARDDDRATRTAVAADGGFRPRSVTPSAASSAFDDSALIDGQELRSEDDVTPRSAVSSMRIVVDGVATVFAGAAYDHAARHNVHGFNPERVRRRINDDNLACDE
jgi:hypothetical protein